MLLSMCRSYNITTEVKATEKKTCLLRNPVLTFALLYGKDVKLAK